MGGYQYTPSLESQLNQPYQDVAATGALGMLPGVLGRMQQQGGMSDIYGQGAATNLGGAQQGMGQLSGLGGNFMGASGNLLGGAMGQMPGVAGVGGQATGLGGQTLGQYGALMNPNLAIQQGTAKRIQDIQSGKLDVDPMLVQQLGTQERQLNEQLRRDLGPDYATSSAGIEALQKFKQLANNTLQSANFNQYAGLNAMQQAGMGNMANQGLGFGGYGAGIQGQQFGQGVQGGQFGANVQGQQFGQGAQMGQLYGANNMDLFNQQQNMRQGQLAGAGAMLNNTAAMQGIYSNIPTTMGQFGGAMANQSQAAVNAQQPYQRDRFGNFQASYSPNQAGFTGQTLQQQGDRLIQSAAQMGGGGGSPQFPQETQSMNAPAGGYTGGGWPMGGY